MTHSEEDIVVTPDGVIADWKEQHAIRIRDAEWYREGYEDRKKLYANPPSFDQYLALHAFVDTMGPRLQIYVSDEETISTYGGTFGQFYPDVGPQDLKSVLDDHLAAMTRAYDVEVGRTLGNLKL